MVYNLALQYVQNSEDAEEITQDVFVSVYKKLTTFDAKATVKTWIYRITINKSLDFIKAKKAIKRQFFFDSKKLDTNENIQLPNFNHPGVILENKEALKRLFWAINQLSENQKTVIILLKIEAKTQKETAEIMNLSEKAIESLFQRAKKKLCDILDSSKDN
jgi:RNA polymerase sigma factor (sigma-70 family)